MEATDEAIFRTLVLEQFKSLQAETLLRIGEYHKLLFFKIASAGALFSYVVSKDSPSVLVVFLAPLLAVIVDFLIINNLKLIGSMGHYIATEIEKTYLPEVGKRFLQRPGSSEQGGPHGVWTGCTSLVQR